MRITPASVVLAAASTCAMALAAHWFWHRPTNGLFSERSARSSTAAYQAPPPRAKNFLKSIDIPVAPDSLSPRQMLDTSDDYASLVDKLSGRAKAGDPEAQYVTYRALRTCAYFRKLYLPKVSGESLTLEAALARRAKQPGGLSFEAMSVSYDRCHGLFDDPSHSEALSNSKPWLDAAADAHYPAALSERAAALRDTVLLARASGDSNGTLNPALEQAFADALDAAATGDPRSVFLMADWVDGQHRSMEEYGVLTSAWKIRACQSGYDCGATSMFMATVCITDTQCAQGDSYKDYFQRLLGSQYEDALRLASQIGAAIVAKDTAALKALL